MLKLGQEIKRRFPKVWGLTGGIAAGKSTVANLLMERGIPVVDVDKIVAYCRLNQGDKIKALLGTDDPFVIGKIIFADPEQRQKLEDLLKPYVQIDLIKILRMLEEPIALVECALFAPGMLLEPVTPPQVITVLTNVEIRIKRLMKRNNITRDYALQIIKAQPSDEERVAISSIVLTNDKGSDDLVQQVNALIPKL